MIDVHRQAFKEEANELLTDLESSLMELEDRPDDADLIGRVFRAMHTIKGSGAMFGFDDIASFTHEVETAFELVRSGRLTVDTTLVNVALAARDQIKSMLNGCDRGGGSEACARIVAELRAITAGEEDEDVVYEKGPSPSPASGRQVTYRIGFKPHRHFFSCGSNPLNLLRELRELGACSATVQNDELPALEEIDPEQCYVQWQVILTTDRGLNTIRDVFIFAEDDCELDIASIDADDGDAAHGRDQKPGETPPGRVEGAPRVVGTQAEVANSIRVPADRLDMLVNLVGELVTVHARLAQTTEGSADAELAAIAEEVGRLTGELRDCALNIRMLPIGSTFMKFKRLVRDLSAELGKEIEMTTDGADTELDKTVIEKLNDPLVHLIRNSIDHGVELPEARLAAGKPRQGAVHLGAVHSGDSVVITIRDDGAGLDKEAIRAKAIEKGIIAPAAELSERELFSLIFAPGFSTAKKISSVSGRGVGMDVVRRDIESLRGSIEIASERGRGTSITVRIPLTLAIIESLLVRIAGDFFVLPLSLVDECVERTRAGGVQAKGCNLAKVRGKLVPCIPLRERFGIGGEAPTFEEIVIMEVNGVRVGLVVDQVVGKHQTVIKSLGRAYKSCEGVSGATILGDGSVALILDVPQMVQSLEAEETGGR